MPSRFSRREMFFCHLLHNSRAIVEVIWGVTLLGGAWRLAGGEHRILRRQVGAGQAANLEHRAANAAVLPHAAWTNRESSLIGADEQQSTVKRCLLPPSPASSGRNRMARAFPTTGAAERGADGAARRPYQGQFQDAPACSCLKISCAIFPAAGITL